MTQLTVIIGYLALLLGLGFAAKRLSRGTSADYLLASHTIGPFLLLMSLFGTTMTAFALVGSTGEAYERGVGVYALMASAAGIVHSLCFYLVGVRLWAFGKRYGYTTQIQFFRDRLESHRIGLFLFPILVGLVVPYLLIGVLGGGITVSKVTAGTFPSTFPAAGGGVPVWLASLVICGVVLVYVFMGGMRGTAMANAFQTMVFMVLGLVTFVVIANELGGRDSFPANVQAATQLVQSKNPQMLTHAKLPRTVLLSFLLIPLSAAMFPHLFQHWLTARSDQSFKLPVIMHPVFVMIVWLPCVLVGVWATSATVDGTVGGERLLPEGINPNAVLGVMVERLSTPLLSGLLTAGILAAIMSSLDSQFLCLGTMFTEDVILHDARQTRFADAQVVWMARGFLVGVVAVTYALSLFSTAGVFDLAIWCFSGFSGLAPLVVAALYWKRLTKAGAYACIVAMVATWTYYFAQSDLASLPVAGPWGLHPVVPIVLVPAVTMFVVSLATKPPSEETLAKFFPPAKPPAGALDSRLSTLD